MSAKQLIAALDAKLSEGAYYDVGRGAHEVLGMKEDAFNRIMDHFIDRGFHIYMVPVIMKGAPGPLTTLEILTSPDVTYEEVADDMGIVRSLAEFTTPIVKESPPMKGNPMTNNEKIKVVPEDSETKETRVIHIDKKKLAIYAGAATAAIGAIAIVIRVARKNNSAPTVEDLKDAVETVVGTDA